MHVRTVDMHPHELLPRAQQRLVTSLSRLRHNIIEHGIAHPPGARDDDRTQGGIRIWDVPQERLVERIVEAREALLVRRRGASTLARDWNVDALQHDCHVLREQAKRCRA